MSEQTTLEETPQNELEEMMVAAREDRTSTEDFLNVLVRTPLFLPSATPAQADGSGLAPVLLTQNTTEYLAVYTTQARASSVAGTAAYCLQVVADWVLAQMPPGYGLVINPGFAIGGQIEPQTIRDIVQDLLPQAARQAIPLVRTHTEYRVNSLQFLSDTMTLLGGSSNGDVALWHYTGALETLSSFPADTSRVFQVAADAAGVRAVVAGRGPLRLWKLPQGVLDREFQFEDDSFTSAAFSPDGTRLLAAGDEEELHIIDLRSGKTEFKAITAVDPDNGSAFALGERTPSITFHPNGSTVMITCCWQGGSALKFCELRSELKPLPEWTLRLPADVLSPASFSPNGNFFVFADWEVNLYAFPAKTRIISFGIQGDALAGSLPLRGKSDIVEAFWSNALFTPDSRTLICGSPSGDIFLWDVPSGRLRQTLTGHDGGVLALALDPTGTRLASSGQDKTLRLWQMPV